MICGGGVIVARRVELRVYGPAEGGQLAPIVQQVNGDELVARHVFCYVVPIVLA